MVQTPLRVVVLLLQIAACFAVLFVAYLLAAMLDSEWGFDGIIGLLFQVLWATLLSGLTIVVCLLVGIPIRILPAVRRWWSNRIFIPVLCILAGITLIVVAHQPQHLTLQRMEGMAIPEKLTPHMGYAIGGWFLCAFGILHLFPPERWMEHIQAYLKRT
jgi:hypothetical protein